MKKSFVCLSIFHGYARIKKKEMDRNYWAWTSHCVISLNKFLKWKPEIEQDYIYFLFHCSSVSVLCLLLSTCRHFGKWSEMKDLEKMEQKRAGAGRQERKLNVFCHRIYVLHTDISMESIYRHHALTSSLWTLTFYNFGPASAQRPAPQLCTGFFCCWEGNITFLYL